MRAERLSKIAVALWAVAATLIEFYYASPGWAALRWVGPLLLAAFAALALVERRSVAILAAAPYLFPAGLYLTTGEYHVHYTIAWLAAMLGMTLPDAWRRGWHAPPRWSVALACWAGVIAVTAPLIVLRSTDFHVDLLTRTRLPHEALGGLTYQSIGWIGHVALLLVIGILWFDWLLSLDAAFMTRWVVAPMAVSSLALSAAAVYQMTRDITFLNPTVYASIERATGTLFDANSAGALAAMWIGGWIALSLAARRWRLVALPAAVLAWAAVWASASRTALGAALVVTLFAALAAARPAVKRPGLLASALLAALLAVTAGVVALSRSEAATGPAARLRGMVADASSHPDRLVRSLWNRDGYGVAANRMIARYPLFGVGVGAFHDMAPEFAGSLPADNAQNWFRHQLAETGLVGSLGWLVFVVSFAWWLLRVRSGEAPALWAIRGVLVAFVLVSLVGMPGQDPAVAITFWTLAAWGAVLAGPPRPSGRRPLLPWLAALVVVLAAGIGTAQLAASRLRVPVRIQRAISGDYAEYAYGFWSPEQDDQGEFRWAKKSATAVVHAAGRRLRLTAAVNFPDLAEHPTHVKAWVDGRLIIDGALTAGEPSITREVPLVNEERVLIETRADRSVVAPPPDGRELALQVRWRFE